MPDDHRPDLYDHVELSWPKDMEQPPVPSWLTADWMPCQDCRANAFLRFDRDAGWQVTIAHDDGCPTLRSVVAPPD